MSDYRKSTIRAICPICATIYEVDTQVNGREAQLCPNCRATGRESAVIYNILRLIQGENIIPLKEMKSEHSIKIIGLSDSFKYAKWLDDKFDYVNTFYHKEPFLDICTPIHKWKGHTAFVISGDIFEHIVGQSQSAFNGAFELLMPGGYLILTVPFVNEGHDIEHYPNLQSYKLHKFDNNNVDVELLFDNGSSKLAENPRFHGGKGATLEMRIFNRERVIRELTNAGFIDILIQDENLPQYGIQWGRRSRPIIARRPV